jgi:hypothetical protein
MLLSIPPLSSLTKAPSVSPDYIETKSLQIKDLQTFLKAELEHLPIWFLSEAENNL